MFVRIELVGEFNAEQFVHFSACDEGDFGSAIELGIDLFCFGAPELHADALQLLVTGYKLVEKPQFIAIAKAHLEKRLKDTSDLSILGRG